MKRKGNPIFFSCSVAPLAESNQPAKTLLGMLLRELCVVHSEGIAIFMDESC